MDVVRRNVEALGGSVGVESSPGGTTFTLRLPLTLAIIRAFFVGVGSSTFAIPMASITECVDIGQIEPDDRRRPHGVLALRGEPLPWLRLDGFLGTHAGTTSASVVVLRHGSGHAGLVVEHLLGEGEAVIKPLGPVFRGLPGFSGTTILGNGRVALVLDPGTLVREVWDLALEATSCG
jgi:two-component system chemotaxis sensor kinase CheA